MTSSAWFSLPAPTDAPRVRLICLPHAGGGVAVFHPWKRELPAEIELVPVQLPGRDARYREALRTDLAGVAEELADAVAAAPGAARLAIFGHSMGALLALELARALGKRQLPPDLLIVSGRAAPRLQSGPGEYLHTLPDADLVERLRLRYGGMPAALLAEPSLLAIYLPILRADLHMVETYRAVPGPAQYWPLLAYGGADDHAVTHSALQQWEQQTSGPFSMQVLPGDHFFYQNRRAEFLPRLVEDIRRWCPVRR
ncbi:thioesterase II family protein [Massilia sp. S19_KUP03_FR1]|uniref:thioesterase II family protein n=1 Tax=Massilia sp. S19_KUP03_FR1 TaxID=3025503 RepID=UPI002FCDD636